MSIPDFQALMLPLLRAAAEGEVRISDVVERLGARLNMCGLQLFGYEVDAFYAEKLDRDAFFLWVPS